MREKRALALYAALLFCVWGLVCRLYIIAADTDYAGRARRQTVTTLTMPPDRGDFYDRDGHALTGGEVDWYAVCVPGEDSYARLFDAADPENQRILYQKRNAAAPFLIRVDRNLTGEGVFTVPQSRRYPPVPLCPHLIGYLDGEGRGVAGLEGAMDDQLRAPVQPGRIECVTNARGGLLGQAKPQYQPGQRAAADVQLTLSAAIQGAVEGVGLGMMESGCILVLDVETAQVLACASFPTYTPQTVAHTVETGEGSLVNRAFSAYAVGSVFKPLLAAAALENGVADRIYNCPGYLDWHGHVYRCAGGTPHGPVDLQAALEKSCNGYFVQLGAALGADKLWSCADRLGFGQPVYVAGGLKAAAGNLPTKEELESPGALANLSFGQGSLLATPVQVGAMMNTIAADGVYRVPSFLVRRFDAQTDQTLEDLRPAFSAQQVFSRRTARTLQAMLAGVVTDGLGQEAAPTWATAAGKTGTAQTGRFDPAGKEYVNLWFAGFFPAEKPRYTVVVMQDDQVHAAHSSASIFARVCDTLSLMEGLPGQNGEKG